MKIGGEDLATDMRRIEGAFKVMEGPSFLAVDANARFDLETALAYGREMEPLDLFWYEEPLDPEDFLGHSLLAENYLPSLATGENLFSRQELLNLLRHGGLRSDRDWIQLDPALAYGLTEYLRVIEILENHGWPRRRLIPHGGHQLALNAAAGLQLGGSESYPGVFQPFGGFADSIPIIQGRIRLHDTPGIGIELKPELHSRILELME
jgi:L-alanine-DL-glutamate epimerase-like enolase superfamily enzyme